MKRVLLQVVPVFFVIGVLALLHLNGVVVCPLKRFLGIPCLTCGTTRGVFALLRGDVLEALRMQPLMVPLVTALGGVWWYNRARELFGRPPWAGVRVPPALRRPLLALFLVLLAANWTWVFVRERRDAARARTAPPPAAAVESACPF